MKGFVDEGLRALLRVPVSASRDGRRTEVEVWIDTAFNGGLAIPRKRVAELGLVKQSSSPGRRSGRVLHCSAKRGLMRPPG